MTNHSMNHMKRYIILAILCLLSFQMNATEHISLNGTDWKLSFWPQPSVAVRSPQEMKCIKKQTIPATVPGNVELDLLAAGLIEDPMIGCNTDRLRQWEGHQWCYTHTFPAPKTEEGQRVELFFGGIDCLGEVWLNGEHIGSPDNQLIAHSYDITPYLKKKNTLQVILRSSLLAGEEHRLGVLSTGNFAAEESVYLRKAPSTFGWDIMPRLVSAGLWRDVELHILDKAHIRDVYYMTTRAEGHSASVYMDVHVKMPLEMYSHSFAHLTLSKEGKKVFEGQFRLYTASSRQTFNLDNIDLWWPRGYGEAALYDAKLELVDEAEGKVWGTDERRIGFRTVRLERNDINLPPDHPGKFQFFVNNVPIFVRGTNWVPADALHSRDKQWYKPTLDMVSDLNCNMVRCWGGNVYEDHEFYNLCDEKGLLVWQDFTMGCNVYPQRTEFCDMVEKEAVEIVCKLRNHPSIALWAGNNEDDACTHWSLSPFNIDPGKDRVSRETLARVVYEFDPTRTYLPSSPYFSEEVYKRGCRENELPEAHLWGPRGYYKADYYAKATNPFVSEIGYHGCPNKESLEKMMTPECVYPWTDGFQWNEEWLTKSVRRFPELGQTNDRNNLMLNQIRCVFGDIPTDLDGFIFASQSVQAEAMKFFVEKWRAGKFSPFSGIIWWNVRDGWPLISDAVTVYWCSKKLAYYYIRHAQQSICCMIRDSENGYDLVAVNDTQEKVDVQIRISDVASGRLIHEGSALIEANGKTLVTHLAKENSNGVYLIEYQVGGRTFRNHYLYGEPPYDLARYKELMEKINVKG